MQKFSYHTHTNFLGFDGRNTAEEMIKKAEEIGFEEIGISNHFIYHPNFKYVGDKMIFTDYDKFEKMVGATVNNIRTASLKSKIKVFVGFEVDFFPSKQWCDTFEKIRKNIEIDYFIGSTHIMRDDNETDLHNFYHYFNNKQNFPDDVLQKYIGNYWKNIAEAVKSGYFDFIAHIDVYKIFKIFDYLKFDDEINNLIETFGKYKTPYELNTSGWTKNGVQHPDNNFLTSLRDKNVPVVINDDAHSVDMLGQHFDKAEELLSSLNYTNRWKLEK